MKINTTDHKANGWSDDEYQQITKMRDQLRAVAKNKHGDARTASLGVMQFAMEFVVTHADSAKSAKRAIDYMFDCYAHDRWEDWPAPNITDNNGVDDE